MSRYLFLVLLGSCALPAQSPNTLVTEAKFPWTVVRDNLLKMAEKMPEENYSFRPTPEIETFGQRLAHIAGANLFVCQGVMERQAKPRTGSPTSKAELIALLRQASTPPMRFGVRHPLRRGGNGEDQLALWRTFPSGAAGDETRDSE